MDLRQHYMVSGHRTSSTRAVHCKSSDPLSPTASLVPPGILSTQSCVAGRCGIPHSQPCTMHAAAGWPPCEKSCGRGEVFASVTVCAHKTHPQK